jgi:hypothetical protein
MSTQNNSLLRALVLVLLARLFKTLRPDLRALRKLT